MYSKIIFSIMRHIFKCQNSFILVPVNNWAVMVCDFCDFYLAVLIPHDITKDLPYQYLLIDS